jgi:hypothetical protein
MPPKSKGPPRKKAAFVRSLPDLLAKEVVAKAKAAGISLNEKYVHKVRSLDRLRPKREAARPTGNALEERFIDLVLDIGLARATEILGGLRARLKRGVLG